MVDIEREEFLILEIFLSDEESLLVVIEFLMGEEFFLGIKSLVEGIVLEEGGSAI